MSIKQLVHAFDPPAPPEIIEAAQGLKYRDFLIVSLIIRKDNLFPDNWIYVHSPEVRVGRIQNFKNWSADMVPDASKSCVGMEYFCTIGDALYSMPDADLIQLAKGELSQLGLARAEDVEDGCVLRQPRAYPVYDAEYRRNLDVVRQYLARFTNLQTVGRNGMHRYNNQDHSMLTAILAAENVMGANHDLWEVNTERSYHEEQQVRKSH